MVSLPTDALHLDPDGERAREPFVAAAYAPVELYWGGCHEWGEEIRSIDDKKCWMHGGSFRQIDRTSRQIPVRHISAGNRPFEYWIFL
jgi:hypothetical protein